jgi:small-conductance mechanosensitive channel
MNNLELDFYFLRYIDGNGFYNSYFYDAYIKTSIYSFLYQLIFIVGITFSCLYIGKFFLKKMVNQYPDKVLLLSFVKHFLPWIFIITILLTVAVEEYISETSLLSIKLIFYYLIIVSQVFLVKLVSWIFRRLMQPTSLLKLLLSIIEFCVLTGLFLSILGWFKPLMGFLEAIQFSIGGQVFKGRNIISGIFWGVLALAFAIQLNRITELALHKYTSKNKISSNEALFLFRLFSVSTIVIALVGVLVDSGIEAATLAAFVGALGIGLGFGLQEVVINFISGLNILFEKAMKVGDFVTINNITGRVTHLSSRAIVIRDALGTESIIPNSSITKGILQNHTLSNSDFRVSFALVLSDIQDYAKAREVIIHELSSHSRVLKDEPMDAMIVSLFDNSVQIEVSFWINDLENGQKLLTSELMHSIGLRFKTENIALAKIP